MGKRPVSSTRRGAERYSEDMFGITFIQRTSLRRYVSPQGTRTNTSPTSSLALSCLEALVNQTSCRCRGMARVLRSYMGLFQQHRAHVCPLRLEVSASSVLAVNPQLNTISSWDLHVTSSAHRIKVYSVNTTRPDTARRLKQLADNGQTFEPLTMPNEFALEDEEAYLEEFRKYPREPKN